MNRILLSPEEVGDGVVACLSGRRARHVIDVLNPSPGDALRIGMIDGPTGSAIVSCVAAETVEIACEFEKETRARPRVSLLLALPRPKVMKRLWAPLAMLGVRDIVVTNAAKVERNYFDTHWLDPQHFSPLLVQGLEQSGDTRLPIVSLHRCLKPLVEDELAGLVPHGTRLLAHPGDASDLSSLSAGGNAGHVLLAVGPEGGWTPYEQDLLEAHGFSTVSLGWRRLRTDIACTALLSVVHAFLETSQAASVKECDHG